MTDYDTILYNLRSKYKTRIYPFTPLQLQNIVSQYNIIKVDPTGNIYVRYRSVIYPKYRAMIPAEIVSEFSQYAMTLFPYPPPESYHERETKLLLYLKSTYPTVKFYSVPGFSSIGFDTDLPELLSLCTGLCKDIKISTYNTLWKHDPHILQLYHNEIETNLPLITDLIELIKPPSKDPFEDSGPALQASAAALQEYYVL